MITNVQWAHVKVSQNFQREGALEGVVCAARGGLPLQTQPRVKCWTVTLRLGSIHLAENACGYFTMSPPLPVAVPHIPPLRPGLHVAHLENELRQSTCTLLLLVTAKDSFSCRKFCLSLSLYIIHMVSIRAPLSVIGLSIVLEIWILFICSLFTTSFIKYSLSAQI